MRPRAKLDNGDLFIISEILVGSNFLVEQLYPLLELLFEFTQLAGDKIGADTISRPDLYFTTLKPGVAAETAGEFLNVLVFNFEALHEDGVPSLCGFHCRKGATKRLFAHMDK